MDHVATTEHVTDSGVVFVTWLLVATEGRSVIRVATEAVAPAVDKYGETSGARGRSAVAAATAAAAILARVGAGVSLGG
jgi:hypothetical protein